MKAIMTGYENMSGVYNDKPYHFIKGHFQIELNSPGAAGTGCGFSERIPKDVLIDKIQARKFPCWVEFEYIKGYDNKAVVAPGSFKFV